MSAHFGPSDGGVLTLASVVERASNPASRTGCDVQMEGMRSRVRLWGALPFDWCGNLSLHCHAAGVNIVEVDARHLGSARWAASLLVEPVADGARVRSLDIQAMARHRPSRVLAEPAIQLDTFELTPAGQRAAVGLRLTAADRLGLLASVLAAVLDSGLRPREISVRTRSGRAEDWLSLEGQSGAAPSAKQLANLSLRLGGANPALD